MDSEYIIVANLELISRIFAEILSYFLTGLHRTAIAETDIFMRAIRDHDISLQGIITPWARAFNSFNISG